MSTIEERDSEQQGSSAVDAVAQRVLEASLGAIDLMAIYLGDRLGWYRSLHDDGPATAAELSRRTGAHPRYTLEWLEQQAMSGYLAVDSGSGTGDESPVTFTLPAAQAEVLTDETSLAYLAPVARMFAASFVQLPALLEAYRSGGGVSWAQLGVDAREAQADMNRPWYESALPDALAGIPELHARLSRSGARIADVGCGGGWSSISLARAYPLAQVDGFDVDGPSLDAARANADGASVSDRVTFVDANVDSLAPDTYDVAFAFECVHDMSAPVDVLTSVRQALRPGAPMVVMDEAVADHFAAPGDDLERIMYGFSLMVCLPDVMSQQPNAGTGTVMRRSTLTKYATAAGFASVEVLPIENFGFWRFYLLNQPSNRG